MAPAVLCTLLSAFHSSGDGCQTLSCHPAALLWPLLQSALEAPVDTTADRSPTPQSPARPTLRQRLALSVPMGRDDLRKSVSLQTLCAQPLRGRTGEDTAKIQSRTSNSAASGSSHIRQTCLSCGRPGAG